MLKKNRGYSLKKNRGYPYRIKHQAKPYGLWAKNQVIECLRDGDSNEDIMKVFPGITLGNIAALRAHLTRGSYD